MCLGSFVSPHLVEPWILLQQGPSRRRHRRVLKLKGHAGRGSADKVPPVLTQGQDLGPELLLALVSNPGGQAHIRALSGSALDELVLLLVELADDVGGADLVEGFKIVEGLSIIFSQQTSHLILDGVRGIYGHLPEL